MIPLNRRFRIHRNHRLVPERVMVQVEDRKTGKVEDFPDNYGVERVIADYLREVLNGELQEVANEGEEQSI